MAKSSAGLDAAILDALKACLAALRALPRSELERLPEEAVQSRSVLGVPVELTVSRSLRRDGALLISVRSNRRALLGLLRTGTTEGFLVQADGVRRELTVEEILELAD